MNDILLIPAIYKGSQDLADKTKKLVFGTNEITPAQAGALQTMVQQFVFLAIKVEPFRQEEKEVINNLKAAYDDHSQSPSQIMRNVLFILWKQNNQGYPDFQGYYEYRMNGMISYLKTLIVPDK